MLEFIRKRDGGWVNVVRCAGGRGSEVLLRVTSYRLQVAGHKLQVYRFSYRLDEPVVRAGKMRFRTYCRFV